MKHIELLKTIGTLGIRILKPQDYDLVAEKLDITKNYLSILLKKLTHAGLLRKLFRGNFCLSNNILAGSPLHEFEIGQTLRSSSAICCWSAMVHHGLTDQILRTVYVMSPYDQMTPAASQYVYNIENTRYILIRVKPYLYFGIEDTFIGESPLKVTSIERTLIDGLVRPQYCGGFLEVIEAFKRAENRINPDQLVEYAKMYGVATQKRLGWVFETLDIFPQMCAFLKKVACKNTYTLDVSRPNQGLPLKEWHLKKNF